jgi:hypothetical protein
MARARIIKPGFFTNDDLCELPPLTRLLFAGLWGIADRAGRLEDRPRRIKAEVLPYDDDADVDAMLDALAERGFVERYEANDTKYLQVVNFGKHQTPHIKEAPSSIPAPDEHCINTVLDRSLTIPVPVPITDSVPVPRSKAVTEPTRARARETAAPQAFVLTADRYESVSEFGTYDEVRVATDQWRDTRMSRGQTSQDWEADWRAFVRAYFERQRARAPTNGSGAGTFVKQGADSTDAAFKQVRAIVEGSGGGGLPKVRDGNATTRGILPR